MQLSKKTIKNINIQTGLSLPGEQLFDLPEKVLQFGTGVLLRGLPDYFIDKANRAGIFNGRIVVVKSTSTGGTDEFGRQDGLYTICVRGIENGQKIEETIINSSISRVIAAQDNWDAILECAHNPEMKLIISNTTEVGITLVQDDIRLYPPLSFPGKLLAFLHERFKAFGGSKESGMIIIPTELIIDNGGKLRSILLELSAMNKLEPAFIAWLSDANHFCNSLVDRIVPGKLADHDRHRTEKKLGYSDDLMIMTESFRLWAIESSDKKINEVLSFSEVDKGVVIAADIEKFRELKLRLLNATHSLSCGLAQLAGFDSVKEAMNNEEMSSFIQNLLLQEISPAISDEHISYTDAAEFAAKTMDRFRNPYLDHQWLSISVQYSTKMIMRVIPLLLKHHAKYSQTPELMAMGFAAFILFMKGEDKGNGHFEGIANGKQYPIKDDQAAYFTEKWKANGPETIVPAILGDKGYWGLDLTGLNGFMESVNIHLHLLMKNGVMPAIRRVQLNKTAVG